MSSMRQFPQLEGSSTKPKPSRGNVYDFDEALDLLATCDLAETEVGLLDRIEEEREEELDGQLSEGSDAEDPLDDDDEEDKPQSEEDHDDETETAATETAARGEQSVAEVSDSEENETRADDEDDIPIAVLQKRWEERLKKAPSVAKRVLKRNDIPSHLKSFKAKINDGRCADKKSRVEIEWSTDPPSADELRRWEVKCDVGDKPKLSQEAAYLKDYDSPMEYFNFVIPPDIIEKITLYTNRYAQQVYQKKYTGKQDPKVWKEITTIEMKAFIGALIYGGIKHMGKRDVNDLYARDGTEAHTPLMENFTRDRYLICIDHSWIIRVKVDFRLVGWNPGVPIGITPPGSVSEWSVFELRKRIGIASSGNVPER